MSVCLSLWPAEACKYLMTIIDTESGASNINILTSLSHQNALAHKKSTIIEYIGRLNFERNKGLDILIKGRQSKN